MNICKVFNRLCNKNKRLTVVWLAKYLGIAKRTLWGYVRGEDAPDWVGGKLEELLKQFEQDKQDKQAKQGGKKMNLQNATISEQPVNPFVLFSEAVLEKGRDFVITSIGVHNGTVRRWEGSKNVPAAYTPDLYRILGRKYVLPESAQDKDQYFTKKEVAKKCYARLLSVMKRYAINPRGYTFIEPSAGQCNFYELLPKKRRHGIDIEPAGRLKHELVKKDYLQWDPPAGKNGKYIVIGNPPFGLRGNLALNFIHHSSFADIVAFILPPLFDSTGKGVAGTRVKGFKLAHTEKLPANSFAYPDGRDVDVATVFQVWIRDGVAEVKPRKIKTCDSYIKIYSLSDGGSPSTTRNKAMHHKCDAYLPSTVFSGMKLYPNFSSLPHKRGYGVVFLKAPVKLKKLFESTDWEKVAFRSTNGALNLRSDLIQKVVIKNKMQDK